MLEKIKKNWNEWYSNSLGMIILAICVVLNGHTEISFALYGLAMVLLGIGALYNQNKEIKTMIIKLIVKSREEVIYERMEDLKSGKVKVLTQEEMEELFNSKKIN